MWAYTLRRLLYGVPILLGVSIIVFALIQLAPGDAASLLIPPEASKEVAEQIRAKLGLDQPVYIQYIRWLGRLVQGDLGASIVTNMPVASELASALRNTFVLAIPAAILGFTLGTTFGALAAFHRGRILDRIFSAIAIAGVSLPHYWVGIVLVAIFAVVAPRSPAAYPSHSCAGEARARRQECAAFVLIATRTGTCRRARARKDCRADVLSGMTARGVCASGALEDITPDRFLPVGCARPIDAAPT